MRCAIYSRVSTDKQETANQTEQLKAFAETQGWSLVREYSDIVSGSGKYRRPQFDAMMDAASRREFDVLLFWSLDRCSREGALKTLQYLQALTGYGCKWRSYTESFIDSCGPFADAIVGFLACIAKQERTRISERTLAGLQRARREGKTLGRPRVAVNVEKANRLRAEGLSFAAIAVKLDTSADTIRRALSA
ncbi:MAG: recombinase family protein [Acidobacteriales bacterium]|nr:recombinase family protein [Terriglobales bacterium]